MNYPIERAKRLALKMRAHKFMAHVTTRDDG